MVLTAKHSTSGGNAAVECNGIVSWIEVILKASNAVISSREPTIKTNVNDNCNDNDSNNDSKYDSDDNSDNDSDSENDNTNNINNNNNNKKKIK